MSAFSLTKDDLTSTVLSEVKRYGDLQNETLSKDTVPRPLYIRLNQHKNTHILKQEIRFKDITREKKVLYTSELMKHQIEAENSIVRSTYITG